MILGRSERAFLLGSLFTQGLDLARLRELAAGPLAWRSLLRAAQRTGLAPVVTQAVTAAGVGERVPADVHQALESALAHNAAQNTALLALLARAIGELEAGKVEALPIKGAALLLLDPGLVPVRNVSDVDLLVRRRDVDLATSLLVRRGWRRVYRNVEIDVRGRLLAQGAERPEAQHGVTLLGETGLIIELHHALPSVPDRPREIPEGFFDRAVAARWGRAEVRCPALDDLLAIAAEHAVVHHREQPFHLSKLVMDFQALQGLGAGPARASRQWGPEVGAAIDEAMAVVEEARAGVSQPGALGRGRVERVYSPAWRWSLGLRQRVWTWLGVPAWLWRALRAHGWRAFFPVRPFMVARYKVEPRSPLVPLLYLWRPIRWLFGIVTRR